jgi:hypothetical protein
MKNATRNMLTALGCAGLLLAAGAASAHPLLRVAPVVTVQPMLPQVAVTFQAGPLAITAAPFIVGPYYGQSDPFYAEGAWWIIDGGQLFQIGFYQGQQVLVLPYGYPLWQREMIADYGWYYRNRSHVSYVDFYRRDDWRAHAHGERYHDYNGYRAFDQQQHRVTSIAQQHGYQGSHDSGYRPGNNSHGNQGQVAPRSNGRGNGVARGHQNSHGNGHGQSNGRGHQK